MGRAELEVRAHGAPLAGSECQRAVALAETAEAEPLPGFATADCEVLQSDSVGIVVRWRAGPSLPSSAFRILFEMVDASLFTFRLRPAGDDEAGAAPRL